MHISGSPHDADSICLVNCTDIPCIGVGIVPADLAKQDLHEHTVVYTDNNTWSYLHYF